MPRQLITHPYFKQISIDAKLLYGMLLDRMGLSIKNEWYDAAGHIENYKHPGLSSDGAIQRTCDDRPLLFRGGPV